MIITALFAWFWRFEEDTRVRTSIVGGLTKRT
jgi:hypothetical protein